MSTLSQVTLHFTEITHGGTCYGFERALGTLVKMGHVVRILDSGWHGFGGDAKIYTNRGTIILSVYGGEIWDEPDDPDYYDPSPDYRTQVEARVSGKIISEESFLKMVGAS